MAINNFSIIGHVGSDPKLHFFEGTDTLSIQFSVAVSQKWKTKTGEEKEKTTWVRCTRYTKTQKLAEFIKKGDRIYVEGEAFASAYLKEGKAEPVLEMRVNKIDFLERKSSTATPPAPDDVPPSNNAEDDLPF
ncbi:single-stranded DNA-binding protein [Empedobacter sp. UBA5637]|uniref:single-stranded DNA-binding protein n=1 Tax=Empedobacter sp. UBA5637 TaxID=1946442 RepID=UPI0025BEC585|nr:single-stranded DNA-binding protein [Empedobacter sp. UBA5637]